MTKLSQLKTRCERLAMQNRLEEHPLCLVCGREAVTCHHFFPKSISAYLRLDPRNLIPICNPCHFSHHTKGDPKIHETIKQKMGQEWYLALLADSQIRIKDNIGHWTQKLAELSTLNA